MPPKDVKKEGYILKLKKTLYRLNDASRKFLLKVKNTFTDIGLGRLKGDEAVYYMLNEKGNLDGMVSMHVEDFDLAGNTHFVEMVTEKVGVALDMSQVEDNHFMFTGFKKVYWQVKLVSSKYKTRYSHICVGFG